MRRILEVLRFPFRFQWGRRTVLGAVLALTMLILAIVLLNVDQLGIGTLVLFVALVILWTLKETCIPRWEQEMTEEHRRAAEEREDWWI